MAIVICPSCGGKVSSTRTTCMHCGYEFTAKKTCPECEEVIDYSVRECPICGYEFNDVPMCKVPEEDSKAKTETTQNNYALQQDSKSDKMVSKFFKKATKEQFLRSVFYELTKDEDSPADIMKAKFGEVEEYQTQCFAVYGKADGSYSASVGYNREEVYYETERKYDSSINDYRYEKVRKTRIVTDWSPYNGNIANESCSTIVVEPKYKKLESCFFELLKRNDLEEIHEEYPDSQELPNGVYDQGITELKQKVRYGIHYPGDEVKDISCKISISDYVVYRCLVPTYKVCYEYNGERYYAEGFAIDGCTPVFDLPKESSFISVLSETSLNEQEKKAEAKANKPFWAVITMWIMAFLGFSLGIALINVATIVIGFSVMASCIVGSIILYNKISKNVKLVRKEYATKQEKLKLFRSLLLNKKFADYGFEKITDSEKIYLGISGVDLNIENSDLHLSLDVGETSNFEQIDSKNNKEEVSIITITAKEEKTNTKNKKTKNPITKNEKYNYLILKTLPIFNIASIVVLVVGIAFLIAGYYGYTEINSYIKSAFMGEILPLLTVVGAIVVFISLLLQLYFDINKTATFKKTLILTSIAVTFNIVAIVFGFISNGESKYYAEILVFSILASVCLLPIVARLVLLILCKKINNIYESKGDGKKLLALILSSVLFVFVFGGAVIKESIVQEEFFYVSYIGSENRLYATITGYSGDKKEIVIPETYKGYDINAIGEYSFSVNQNITSITISKEVKRIEDGAFYCCKNLTCIKFEEGSQLESIGDYAFLYCDNLTSIEIPNSVTSIGDDAFSNCYSLTSVTIGNSVTSIGSSAFSNCDSLTSVVIGDSVTSIGSSAFYSCDSLTSVTIGNSVTSIGNSVTSIGDYAFYDCDNLTSVTIGNSVTSIGYEAFYDCDNLTSVTIGNSVTSIDWYAFYDCPIETATIPTTAIGYIPKSKLKMVILIGGTSIGYSAFSNCVSLTSIVIPDSVTSIGNDAFRGCSSLTSVNYNGTIAEWNSISKVSGWAYNVDATVYCTDGNIII